MINGIGIPVLTPFKFYPVNVTTGDGVNFQNTDNTKLNSQVWEGINPKNFVQPIPRFWNDYTYGIDFQIYLDEGLLAFNDLRVAIVDLDGVILQQLILDSFFTYSPSNLRQIRVTAPELHMDDGCYQIKIYENAGDDMYLSEVINIADTHDNTYPLEYSNFENDFGLIFLNATAETWVGKILFPMRMFEPKPLDERETYMNDVSVLETLRNLPLRILEIESFPVATWYAEKIKMIFGCSVLTLNKYVVNNESTPEIELIQETDVMQIQGSVQLNEFSDNYLQDENIDEPVEMLTSWASQGATVGDWDTFDTTGSTINRGVYEDSGVASAWTNTIAVLIGNRLLIDITISGSIITNGKLLVPGTVITPTVAEFDLVMGKNVIIVESGVDGNMIMSLDVEDQSDFGAVCSVKKLI